MDCLCFPTLLFDQVHLSCHRDIHSFSFPPCLLTSSIICKPAGFFVGNWYISSQVQVQIYVDSRT